jgi:hypothetical protein
MTNQVRTLLSAADAAHATRIQNDMVRRAALFRGELEAEMVRELNGGGFIPADVTTAQTNIIAAVKAVLW